MSSGRFLIPIIAIAVVAISIVLLWPRADAPEIRFNKPAEMLPGVGQQASSFIPTVVSREGFTSSDSCLECHEGNYESWHNTFHRTMTQVASPESVVAPFDDIELEGYGQTYRLYREGDEFWAEMPDPEMERDMVQRGFSLSDPFVTKSIPKVKRRIVMTTGSHHMQGYWTPGNKGLELLQFPWIYAIEQKRWLPVDDVFIRPPGSPRRTAVWNTSCIQCHSVDGNPKGIGESGEMYSEVAEFGISCGACHGPAEEHIQLHRNLAASGRQLESDEDPIVNPETCTAEVSAQICGQCHSAYQALDLDHWWQHGYDYIAGDSLDEHKEVFQYGNQTMRELSEVIADAAFWNDGTMRVGGREYIALTQSPCYDHNDESRRMSCLSCHSMHSYEDPSDQLSLAAKGNDACLQCHTSLADNLQAHTHHAPDSSGSLCYNCHMPHTSYALLKGIRSHRVDTPNITASMEGKPNGCNQCHLDKTLEWTATHLKDWYDIEPPDAMPEEHKTYSASLLWLLKGDAAQRAITAWTMGWDAAQEISGDGWQAPFVAPILNDPYPAIRYMAYAALKTMPGFEELEYDYIASAEQRNAIASQVLETWSAQENDVPDQRSPLLIDDAGAVNLEKMVELLNQRDDRPILFPE